DKVVLITGASGGIGKAIAKKFAEAGTKVALNDIVQAEEALKKLVEELNESKALISTHALRAFVADVSKLEEVE
ncbi:unnamed protein product, partial [marine sediment metagenome]